MRNKFPSGEQELEKVIFFSDQCKHAGEGDQTRR